MSLDSTISHMKSLLLQIYHDLKKALKGNKAASKRVRTSTIKFAKTAKNYRKKSIARERAMTGKKRNLTENLLSVLFVRQ